MFVPVTGSTDGNGRKIIRKMQNAIVRMFTGRPILPMVQGPNLIGFEWLNLRIANNAVGMA